MKTTLPQRHRFWMCSLLLTGTVLLAGSAYGEERLRIPPPPPPDKVIRDIRGFLHRVADGVKGAGKKTWTAIRGGLNQDEPGRAPRTAPRSKKEQPARVPGDSFANSKEAVPYRYDDAEDFDDRMGPDPATREPGKAGPGLEPEEEVKPAPPPLDPSPPKATVPPGDAPIEFASPVPGKRGLVYPPGAESSPENMVDVTGFQPGQIVRNPRTGKIFRVP